MCVYTLILCIMCPERILSTLNPKPFRQLEKLEWDTLLFFYAVIMCVGGLSLLGFLDVASRAAYVGVPYTLQ